MLHDGSDLPIPNRERNNGGDLQVYHCRHELNGTHPWRKVAADDVESDPGKSECCQHTPPPERKILNLSLPTFVLSCILFLVTAALIVVGGLLGNKVARLENTIPSLATTNTNTNTNITTVTMPATNETPTPPTILVAGWHYLGCYYDSSARILAGESLRASNMTNDVCGVFCGTGGGSDGKPRHFGTQARSECFCGTATDVVLSSRRAPDWACNQQCRGRGSQAENCGGNWVLSLWERDGE